TVYAVTFLMQKILSVSSVQYNLDIRKSDLDRIAYTFKK
ncbi:MAG: hypothetical protein ACI8R1_002405, partial [Psychrobacter glaciei]